MTIIIIYYLHKYKKLVEQIIKMNVFIIYFTYSRVHKESNQFSNSSISPWEVYLQDIYFSSINLFHIDLSYLFHIEYLVITILNYIVKIVSEKYLIISILYKYTIFISTS